MRRRALLASVPAVAGCVAGPPGAPASTAGADVDLAVTDFAVTTRKIAPEKRYLVRVTRTYSADAVADEPGDQTVVDVSDVADPDVRAVLKDVLAAGRIHRDSIPDGLRETVERVDFFTLNATTSPDGTASHWGVSVFEANPNRPPAVRFDAQLADDAVSAADPGAIDFSLENTGDRTYRVFSGTVPPFGVLWAERTDESSDDHYLLWRDYADQGCVSFTDRGVLVCDIGKVTPIDPGETIERTYELRPEPRAGVPLQPGDYAVSDTLTYHRDTLGPSTEVEWKVAFTAEDA